MATHTSRMSREGGMYGVNNGRGFTSKTGLSGGVGLGADSCLDTGGGGPKGRTFMLVDFFSKNSSLAPTRDGVLGIPSTIRFPVFSIENGEAGMPADKAAVVLRWVPGGAEGVHMIALCPTWG